MPTAPRRLNSLRWRRNSVPAEGDGGRVMLTLKQQKANKELCKFIRDCRMGLIPDELVDTR
jgi:hypothetical protein